MFRDDPQLGGGTTPPIADHDLRGEQNIMICPDCGTPTPIPEDAAGALADCSACPATPLVGDLRH